MKNRISKLIPAFIGVTVIVCVVSTISLSQIQSRAQRKEQEVLPVIESTALYPTLTLPSITEEASYILHAKVVKVEDTLMKEMAVSLTENPNEATETLSYPVTPVILKVKNAIKGEISEDTFTYYEDGGKTPTYIQLPDGFYMKEGMELILFLTQDGYCWGEQSMFPIIKDQVLLNEMALDYIDEEKVSTVETAKIKSVVKEQISEQTVSTISKEDFIDIINSLQ